MWKKQEWVLNKQTAVFDTLRLERLCNIHLEIKSMKGGIYRWQSNPQEWMRQITQEKWLQWSPGQSVEKGTQAQTRKRRHYERNKEEIKLSKNSKVDAKENK